MVKKVLIGNLSYDTTEDKVRSVFHAAYPGKIESINLVRERHTGLSKGYGFVTFKDDSAAGSALGKEKVSVIDGRTIRVEESRG